MVHRGLDVNLKKASTLMDGAPGHAAYRGTKSRTSAPLLLCLEASGQLISFLGLNIVSAPLFNTETHFLHHHSLPSWAYECQVFKAGCCSLHLFPALLPGLSCPLLWGKSLEEPLHPPTLFSHLLACSPTSFPHPGQSSLPGDGKFHEVRAPICPVPRCSPSS